MSSLRSSISSDGKTSSELEVKRGPLDWDLMVAYFARRAIPGVEHVADGVYRRTVVVGGTPSYIELAPAGSTHVTLRCGVPVDGVVPRARRIINLDAPVGAANRHLAGDSVLGPLVAARPGLRVPGAWDPFEVGVRAIIGQQVTVTAASTITGRLAARLGKPVAGLAELGLQRVFPPPETVARGDLSGLGLTGARAEALRTFAAAVAAGDVPLDQDIALDDLVTALTDLRGLGPWTAQYVALRLGHPDAFPGTDLGVRRALERLDPRSQPIGARAEAWRPWRASAVVHLWASDRVP
ncbi:MAG: DNA-3-methyladenine glycosylase family protein [Acidimicrobiales bacterium]